MSSSSHPGDDAFGNALLSYSRDGVFPDEDASAAQVASSVLPAALDGLRSAKNELETEIRGLSQEVAPDVETWMVHAKSLQHDIDKSRRLASEIVRQAEAEEHRANALHDAETYVNFLEKEQVFNLQLGETLHLVRKTTESIERAELLVEEGKLSDAIKALDDTASILEQIPADRSVKLVRILNNRVSDLREVIHEQLRHRWNSIVQLDSKERYLVINADPTAINETISGLRQYNEVDVTARQLGEKFNSSILQHRLTTHHLPSSIEVTQNTIALTSKQADPSLVALFKDLETVMQFLHDQLPSEIVTPLADAIMSPLSSQLTSTWLDRTIPDSLDRLTAYQEALDEVSKFANMIDTLRWPGASYFRDWVSNASKNWLNKRRETCLNRGRNGIALGLGTPQHAEHKEQRLVSREEGVYISGDQDATLDDWDSGWNSGDEEKTASDLINEKQPPPIESGDDADGTDAWGWGDDDTPDIDSPVAGPSPSRAKRPDAKNHADTIMRQLTLTEEYWTSSMPRTIFSILEELFEDTGRLSQQGNEVTPIATAAGGLGNIASLVVALYRAVSPFYHENDPIGFMYAYNDAIWFCDTLRDFSVSWQQRPDLTTRVSQGLTKLEPEIKALESFGRRAYGKEMDTQRLVLKDLLGGSQNFLQQEGMEESTDAVISHIQQISQQWKKILTPSVWRSAIGSLVNTVSTKIINDVFDLSDMAIDEAELTAKLIAKITTLDSLFTSDPSTNGNDHQAAPLMAEYADKWLKLQFLSEVLQSNLNDIKWLWFESELSLHFTREEVVDLIHLSFENNANVRAAVKEIKDRPCPERGLVR